MSYGAKLHFEEAEENITMSEHAYVLENIAAYVAGGLKADESAEIEAHLAECPDCARAVAEYRALDGRLGGLFVAERPNPALEDRVIHAVRDQSRRRRQQFSTAFKAALATAAVILLAIGGAGISSLVDQEGILSRALAANNLKATNISMMGLYLYDASEAMPTGEFHGYAGSRPGREDAGHDLRTPAALAEELHARLALEDQMTSTKETALGRNDTPAAGAKDMTPLDNKSAPPMSTMSPDGENLATGGGAKAPDGTRFGMSLGTAGAPPAAGYFNPAGDLARQASSTKITTPAPPPKDEAPGNFFGRSGVNREKELLPNKLKGIKQEIPKSYSNKSINTSESDAQDQPPGQDRAEKGQSPAKQPEGSTKGNQAEGNPPPGRKIIRSGEIEFEVKEFDEAVAAITRLVHGTKGGYVDTVNSEKLPNGKVRGSVVVRVPPDQLDKLVLELRQELGKMGELLGQRIGSQDITKMYTDMESRLKAARTMEERLLKIIKDGQGAIKDLLQAEKELGVWRTKIEEIEGELRYYNNLVSLSTLTIQLREKEIRTAALITEVERVQAGIEVEDVEKALREALDAITEVKGRVTRSELKQQAAGQFNATLNFEVDPDKAGPLRDRLRQLGNMVRLNIDRVQQTENNQPAPSDGKIKRGDTQFFVSIYNLANVAPRETVVLRIAAADVPEAFAKLREAVAKAKSRVLNAQLNEQNRQNIEAQLAFDVRRTDEAQVKTALNETGEVLTRTVNRIPEGDNVTDAKVQFRVDLVQAASIPPRETVKLAIEVTDVETTLTVAATQVKEAGGRVVESQIGQERNGRVTARAVYDVPLPVAAGLVEKLKKSGVVRVQQIERNPQAPEGKLALARIDLTVSNVALLVPQDETLWTQIRHGLSLSLRGLSVSVSWLIVAVLFLLPWALLLYALVWLARRLWGNNGTTTVPTMTGK